MRNKLNPVEEAKQDPKAQILDQELTGPPKAEVIYPLIKEDFDDEEDIDESKLKSVEEVFFNFLLIILLL